MIQGRRNKRQLSWLRDILETLTLVLLMILAIRFAMQNFRIDGESMEPTLHNREFVMVDKAAYLFHAPTRGDIVVFEYPLDPQVYYVKRIIAVPGDVLSVIGQRVIVDGVTLSEPYINADDPFNPFPSFSNHIIDSDSYFVMGDNRGNSSDSRQWGLVPRKDIVGKVAFIYWPFGQNNFGLLPDVSNTFAKIK